MNIVYAIILVFLTLSGFGQMPVFKRYYIADIPGFDWLAESYVTHLIHYVSATLLIAMSIYAFLVFLVDKKELWRLTRIGMAKCLIIARLIVTGSLLAIKNLSDIYFAHSAIIALDLIHLILCILLLIISGYALIRKKSVGKIILRANAILKMEN